MRYVKRTGALAFVGLLTACGGDAGAGSATGVTAPTPTPASTPTPTQTPAPTPTPTPTTVALNYTPIAAARPATGGQLALGKCVNIANDLEAPNEGDWGPAITDPEFAFIKAGGFDSVRLPVRFSGHAAAAAPYAIDPAFMARVRHVVDTATAAGLSVIIDMHNYDELFADPAGNTDRFAGLWRQIAIAFQDEPATVSFELINEPHDKLTNTNLLSVDAPALAAIRDSNPTRTVVIGGQDYSSIRSLDTLPVPDDPNVVPTFHFYDPYTFTHQGVSFVANPPPVGRAYPTQADADELNADLALVRSYIARTGRVPFVGEYGANEEKIALDQRLVYYHAVSSGFASVGVQTCAWGYRNAFPLRNDVGWLPGALDAITTTTTER